MNLLLEFWSAKRSSLRTTFRRLTLKLTGAFGLTRDEYFVIMSASQKPATVLAAVDDLLLRAAAAFPSSDPQDMHTYATKAPSQPFLKEIMDVTQSISSALVTMTSVTDPKVISVLKEHAVHDQTVFEVSEFCVPLRTLLRMGI